MPKNPPDERLVYLALRHEFLKGDAPSKLKKIKERVLKQGESSEMKALIQEHNIDSICQVAKGLLDGRVYHSTIQAKIRFPESAERNASEAEAARCEADALKDVKRGGLEQSGALCTTSQARQEPGKLATRLFAYHSHPLATVTLDIFGRDILLGAFVEAIMSSSKQYMKPRKI
ncbi:hypothetical protein LTR12_018197 [Friedmanniomyces endolithicus]|nr:hypothetical protein LTR12_018197 [Friedmanniomyces endolithicus]